MKYKCSIRSLLCIASLMWFVTASCQTDTIAKSKSTLGIQYQNISFLKEDNGLATYQLTWSQQINPKWRYGVNLIRISYADVQEHQFGFNILKSIHTGGYTFSGQFSTDERTPNLNVQLGYYKFINSNIVFNSNLSLLKTKDLPINWPASLSIAKIHNNIAWSLQLNQDIAQILVSPPLIKAAMTYESPDTDILNVYVIYGAINRQELNAQILNDGIRQIGVGTWARKNINHSISLTGALGYTKIIFDESNTSSIINTGITLTIKF